MQTHLVAFATASHYPLLSRLLLSAKWYGNFDQFHFYTAKHLRGTDFWRQNEAILQQKRGAGFWLWKPYIILQTMQSVAEGDIIMYCDCKNRFVAPITPLIAIAEQKSIVLFMHAVPYTMGDWSKRDAFILLNADTPPPPPASPTPISSGLDAMFGATMRAPANL